MNSMDVDSELVIGHPIFGLCGDHMVPRSAASSTVCSYCDKNFSNRKKCNDHCRTVHGLYYVLYPSGSSILSSCLPQVIPTPSIGEKHVLAKEKSTRGLSCHRCHITLASACDKIKAHYHTHHKEIVHAFLGYPHVPTGSLPAGDNSMAVTPSPDPNGLPGVAQNSVMDVDPFPVDDPPEDSSVRDDPMEPDEDSPESWDLDSIYSDCCDETLAIGQEDTVVPSSFTLPSSAIPPTDNKDEDSISPPNGVDLSSEPVYGSESGCFDPS